MTEIIQETIIMFIGFVMLVVVIFLNIDRAMRKSNTTGLRYVHLLNLNNGKKH